MIDIIDILRLNTCSRTPWLAADSWRVGAVVEGWRVYKQSVPVFGAVILDPGLSKVLLVQSGAGEHQNQFYPVLL